MYKKGLGLVGIWQALNGWYIRIYQEDVLLCLVLIYMCKNKDGGCTYNEKDRRSKVPVGLYRNI